MIEVKIPDMPGVILKFPDGTSQDIIRRQVNEYRTRTKSEAAGLAGTSEASRIGMANQTTPERDTAYGSERSPDYYRQPEWLQDTGLGRADLYFSGLTDAATQGFTMGAADEVAAAGGYLGNLVDPSEEANWEQSLEEARAPFRVFREESPVASYAADIGGGLVTAPLAPGRAIGPLWQLMARAGAEGGAGGFLSGEGTGNRIIGGGIGAGAGAILSGAASLAGAGLRRISDIFSDPSAVADRRIAESIARDADASNVLPEQYATRMATEIADDPARGLTAFDVGGENMMGRIRSAARTPGAGRETATSFLNERQLGSYDPLTGISTGGSVDRVLSDVADAGMPTTPAFSAAQDISQALKKTAGPAYEAAYKADIDVPKLVSEVDEFFDRPTFRAAIPKTIRMMADDGVDVSDLQKMNPVEVWDKMSAGDPRLMQFLDYVKRNVGAVANRPGNASAAVLNEANDAFKKILASHNAPYKDIISRYADDSANIRAVQFGEKLWSAGPDEITRFLSNASDSEKTMFRIGAAQAIRDKLLSAGRGANLQTWLAGNRQKIETLRASFPDQASFLKFMDNLMKEGGMTERFGDILKNSVTAQAAAEIADDLGGVAGFFGDVATGNGGGAITRAVKVIFERGADKMVRGIGEQTAAQIARKLASGTAADRAAYITKLVQDGILTPQIGKELRAVVQAVTLLSGPIGRESAELTATE